MATPAIQRLLRVLELEQRQGWRDRAVVGGLAAMAERWQREAKQEGADPQLVEAAVALMVAYGSATAEERPERIALLRRVLNGEAVVPPAPESRAEPVLETVEAVPDRPAEMDLAPKSPVPAPEAAPSRKPSRRKGDLDAPVTVLSGVGPAVAGLLAKLGVTRVRDLLWHLPTRYDDYSRYRTIAQLTPGEQATVVANLWEIRERKVSMNRQMVQGILADGTGTLHATWWSKWVRSQLKPGTTMRFSGKVGLFLGHKTLENPQFEDVDEEMVSTGRLAPVYPLTEGLSNKKVRALVRQVLDDYLALVSDPLPAELRAEWALPSLADALSQVHFPDDSESQARAMRRLAFDELLAVQLGVLQRRRALRASPAPAMTLPAGWRDLFAAQLPFPLTNAQARVIDETLRDLAQPVPMTRLVQGDVGSGKTAVAAAAMAAVAANGFQSALLAPTQILAEQHDRSLSKLLAEVQAVTGRSLRVGLLTGRVTGQERATLLAALAAGELDIVVGTTALIQEGVHFANLGLVVVDEQHRFGVQQRGALRTRADGQPHLLVMSATPIPRSLALTIYGDLDLSVIDEMPPGRTPVTTRRFAPPERERIYGFMRREARAGRQAFIVYPLVEESEKLEAGAAVEEHARLQREIFPDLRVALLHGRMSGAEKDAVMASFAAGEYDILVSTTVIEVGIDVPNASVIMIEDAERFGLAQLHQLRGRVGRGGGKSYCALISRADTPEARERLDALVQSNSGFTLAEKDLALRGPGDFLGTRQSGLPTLRIAPLSDVETILAARRAAEWLFGRDPDLTSYPLLAAAVETLWRGHGDIS